MGKRIWTFASGLGICASILSLSLLVRLAFDVGFAAPLLLLLEYYQHAITFVLGWAEPPISALLDYLEQYLRVDLDLLSHWKHIFVLLGVYFGADFRTNWSHSRNRAYAAFSVVMGSLVALLSGIAVGTVSLDDATRLMFAVSFPVGGMIFFELCRTCYTATFPIVITSLDTSQGTWWQKFRWGLLNYVLPMALIGCSALAVAGWIKNASLQAKIPSAVLLPLAFLMMTINVFWLARASWLATFSRHPDESWKARFLRSGSASIGRVMLVIVLGTTLFLVLNAGLRLAGL